MPSITSWNRLEPRCRDADMQRTVNARIFDPLWLLTRQWQMGEYRGEDAGSPVSARVRAESAFLSRCHLGELPPNTALTAAPYDPHGLPLEVMVERERVRPAPAAAPGDLRKAAHAVGAGLHFLRMLDLLLPPDRYRQAFVARYALLPPDDAMLAALEPESRAFIDMMVGRAPDGRRLEAAFRSTGAGAGAEHPAGRPRRGRADGAALAGLGRDPVQRAARRRPRRLAARAAGICGDGGGPAVRRPVRRVLADRRRGLTKGTSTGATSTSTAKSTSAPPATAATRR